MALQVGAFCYASPVEAGRAACSQFQSVTTVTPSLIKSVSCSSSDALTGALNLDIVTTDLSSGVSTYSTVQQVLTYPPCSNTDYLVAAEFVISSVLSLVVLWWSAKKIINFLEWSRGSHE